MTGGILVGMSGQVLTQPEPERLVYSMTEAARSLGISRAKLYGLVARGELAVMRFPTGSQRISRRAIDQWIGAAEARSARGEPS